MKRCLRKWLDNANKLKDRDNKLQDALDGLELFYSLLYLIQSTENI